MAKPIIKTNKVSVIYNLGKANEVRALKDISVEIYPGEFIIFFGPSGCGKSTLLYAMAGLEKKTQGEVFVDQQAITKLDDRLLEKYHQHKIGMIFQAYYLINSLSVRQNVILPELFINTDKQTREEKADTLLKRFGVHDQSNKLPTELSGGQQQRVAIARALVNDPNIILADEPVGNLDSKSAQEVLELLKSLNEKSNKTIILVTHNPELLSIAHRVFYMKDGSLTGIKVNKQVKGLKVPEDKREVKSLSQELDLLIRTYSSIAPAKLGYMLIPFKAKQIVVDVLTKLSVEEVTSIEKEVESLLVRGVKNIGGTQKFLDKSIESGGLGLDKRKANKIANEIKSILDEILYLEKAEKMSDLSVYNTEVVSDETIHLRQYLMDRYDIYVDSLDQLKIIDKIVEQRINNKISMADAKKLFDLPQKRGGAGLDKRIAKKLAKRMELLMLGKFK